MLSDLPSLTELASEAPRVVRVAVGCSGALAAFWGARLYRPGLLLGAFGAGAIGAVGALHVLAGWVPAAEEPFTVAVGSVSMGVVGAAAAHVAHRLALVVLGSLVGLVAGVSLLGLGLPWWVVPLGAAGGAFLFPRVVHPLLAVMTAAVGAVLLAWALGHPESLPWVGGIWFLGASVQLRGGSAVTGSREKA